MKKTVLFICSILMLFTLVSCHSLNELETASNEIKEGNFSVYYEVETKSVYGKKELVNSKQEFLLKQNGNQQMLSTWSEDGSRYDQYVEVVEEEVELYSKSGKNWKFDGKVAKEEYVETVILPEIEINSKNFYYENKVWHAKEEVVEETLKNYFENILASYDYMPDFEDSEVEINVNCYDIILDINSFETIIFDYEIEVTFPDEKKLVVDQVITAEYSDIATTVLLNQKQNLH